MPNKEEVEQEINKLPTIDIEDGPPSGDNVLNANPNNTTEGGRYVVGNTLQDANGKVLAKVNRVLRQQDQVIHSEQLGGSSDPSKGLDGGSIRSQPNREENADGTAKVETEAQRIARETTDADLTGAATTGTTGSATPKPK